MTWKRFWKLAPSLVRRSLKRQASSIVCIPTRHHRTCVDMFVTDRIISTTVPSFANSPNSLIELVCKLNPKIWEPPSLRATPTEAKAHIRAIDSALDLLKRLLVLDPTRRYTSHQALMHGFLQDDLPPEEKEKEEVLHAPGEGACKAFHWVNEEGLRTLHGKYDLNCVRPDRVFFYRFCNG
jgi:serine/threonine protein kinase